MDAIRGLLMKKNRILIVSIFLFMLVLPLAAMNATTPSVDVKAPIEVPSAPAQSTDFDKIGAFEGIVTQIDPTGGVRNAVGTFQNASFYGVGYTAAYKTAVEGQMAAETGFVSIAQLEVSGRSVYPTGRVSDTVAMLTLIINPIIVFPDNPDDSYLLTPTLEEAHSIGDTIVNLYEADLGLTFERLTTLKMMTWAYLYYDGMYRVDETTDVFYIQYVSVPGGMPPLTAMRNRLSGLGGFMDLLGGSNWPVERTVFAETLLFDHTSDYYGYPPGYMNPLYMQSTVMRPHIRATAAHAEYIESVNVGVIGMAGFDVPGHLSDGSGDETYSLKQHVGYTGDIENLMFQDASANSISAIAGIAPTSLDVAGVSVNWDHLDKDFSFNSPGDLYLPTGQTIPGTSTADEIISAMLVAFPQLYAMQLNMSLMYWDPSMFDYTIDGLWGSPGPFPDMREYFLEFDWSMVFTTFPVEELNLDALRMLTNEMGINPDSLMADLNETLFEDDPMRALVEAFIRSLDSYHLLDILVNTTYSNATLLESYINEYIGNIETFLEEFAGVSLPSSYATKEAFAELIEDHFGLILQGLWDAMAAFTGDTSGIKAAVQAMVDPVHLAEETVPYIWADLYASVVTEYDYDAYINFDVPVYPEPMDPSLYWLSTEDIVLTFDLDISNIAFDGPHLTITKSVPGTVAVGGTETVTITVENIGDATAYDLKILDGISAGFDADKQYYWNRATLNAGDTWTVTTEITGEQAGKYAVIPAILCYFNVSLNTWNAGSMLGWDGAAMYTASAINSEIRVGGGAISTPLLIIAVGSAGIIIIVIVVIIKKR
jgi:hypothetical protein